VFLVVWSAGDKTPAGATTVGGQAISADGAFVLSGGRLLLPTFHTVNQGQYGPPETRTDVGIQSFGPHDGGWRELTLDTPTAGAGVPVIAARGASTAIAWIGTSGLQSALLGPAAPIARTTHTGEGEVGEYAVAVGPGGSRAIAWSDGAGTHVQVVSKAGVVSPSVSIGSTSAQSVTVSADDSGGWWVVILTGGHLSATDLSSTGVLGAPVRLAYSALRVGRSDRLLVHRAWLALADGHGGLWVGLPYSLVHVSAAGQARTLAAGGFLALAEGEHASAFAQDIGRDDVVVRILGASLGPAIRLDHAGLLMDVAFDAPRRMIVLLTAEHGPVVRLREITLVGQVRRSQMLAGCRHRQSGQIEASAGLIAVSCAGRAADVESGGGGSTEGRYNRYLLLRAGRKLRGNSYFDGSENF
jgi:hypothetical protein